MADTDPPFVIESSTPIVVGTCSVCGTRLHTARNHQRQRATALRFGTWSKVVSKTPDPGGEGS